MSNTKRKKGSRLQNTRGGWKECFICLCNFKTKEPTRKHCTNCDDIAVLITKGE